MTAHAITVYGPGVGTTLVFGGPRGPAGPVGPAAAGAFVPEYVTPQDHGAPADGALSDHAAFVAALGAARTRAVPVYVPKADYVIDAPIALQTGDTVTFAPGAAIEFTASGVSNLFVADGTPARIEDIAIIGEDWTVSVPNADLTNDSGYVLHARRVSRVWLRGCRVSRGKVATVQLRSDFPVRNALSLNIPDLTAATEISMASELSYDVLVERFAMDGVAGQSDAALAGACISIRYAERWTIRDGRISHAYNGVVWNGGDANPNRDGAVGGKRWVRQGRVGNVRAEDITLGGVWGSQGELIDVEGCTAVRCGDFGLHDEGGRAVTFRGGVARDCIRGMGAYFHSENVSYVDCHILVDDPTICIGDEGYVVLWKWNNGFASDGGSVSWSGGSMVVRNATLDAHVGRILTELSGVATFENALLENARVTTGNNNGGRRVYRDLTFRLPFDPGVAFDLFNTGPSHYAVFDLGIEAMDGPDVILDNVQVELGFTPAAGSRFLHADEYVYGETYLTRCDARGFPVFIDIAKSGGDPRDVKLRIGAGNTSGGSITLGAGVRVTVDEGHVYPELFGARGLRRAGSRVDASAALAAAGAFCIATGAKLQLLDDYYLATRVTLEEPFAIEGHQSLSGNVSNSRYVTGFTCATGAGILISGASGNSNKFSTGGVFKHFFMLDAAADTTPPADRQSYDKVPLLETNRAAHYEYRSMHFDGRNKREKLLHVGAGTSTPGATAWSSTISDCWFRRGAVGLYVGGPADATDNHIVNNTFDLCLSGGAIFENPVGGSAISNSFENNPGPFGIAVLSRGGFARNFTIANNYCFNNSNGNVDEPLSAAIIVGGEIPFTDFDGGGNLVSNTQPWSVHVLNNYCVSTAQRHSIRVEAGNSSSVRDNTIQSNATTDAEDIVIEAGSDASLTIIGNKVQNAALFDNVQNNSGGRYSVPVLRDDQGLTQLLATGRVRFGATGYVDATGLRMGDITPGFTSIGDIRTFKVQGASGTWTTVFDTATDFPDGGKGFAILTLAIEQTNGANQSIHRFMVHSGLLDNTDAVDEAAGYIEEFRLPAAYRDAQVYQMASGAFQVRRTNAWHASVTVVALDFPFGDD